MARLSTTIFVSLAVTAGASTIALGAIQSHRLGELLSSIADRHRAGVAQALGAQVETVIQRELRAVEGLAMVIEARAPNIEPDRVQPLLERHRNLYGTTELIVVGDAEGFGVVGDHDPVGGRVAGTDYRDRDYFRALKATGKSAVSRVQMGRRSKSPNIHLAAPIRNAGALRGYVALSIPLDRLREAAIRAVAHTEGARAVILDAEHNIVVDTAAPAVDAIASLPAKGLYRAPRKKGTATRRGLDERDVEVDAASVAATVGTATWTAIVLQPQSVVRAEAAAARRRAMVAVLVVVAMALVFARLIAAWVARPFATLSKVAASVQTDRRSVDVEVPSGRFAPEEASELGRVLLEMIERLHTHAEELEHRVEERTRSLAEQAKELKSARNAAMEASRMKSQFIANMSHEIRTPMNGVLGMTRLLLESVETDEQREYAEAAHSSGTALLDLLNDILDFSKIEAGALVFEAAPFDINDVLDDVASLFRVKSGEHGIELLPRLAPGTPRGVVGDRGRIRQVVANLVSNAIKFTSSGHVAIDVSGRNIDGDVHLSIAVEDTGIGIPEDRLAAIFEVFSQADASTTRRFGGTGLGLSIVRKLARLMRGDVTVSSTVGMGSTFTVHLVVPAAREEPQRLRLAPDHPPMLVVSSHVDAAALLVHQARSIGGRAEVASSLDAAEVWLGEVEFSHVIVDQEFAKNVARLRRHAGAKAALVSWSRIGDEDRLQSGFDASLLRPARIERLFTLLGGQRKPVVQLPAMNLSGRLLLVEDNVVNQKVAQRTLERLGVEVVLATDGIEALAALDAQTFDLVLMDCQMPRMDGYEATRCVRARVDERRGVPIIALTANVLAEDRQRCLDAGMDEHLAKPLTRDALEATLARWLKGPSAKRA